MHIEVHNQQFEAKIDNFVILEESNKKEILCIKSKQSVQTCQNVKCQKYAFLCGDENCQCQNEHKNCITGTTKKIIKCIFSKIVSLQSVSEAITIKIQKAIDELCDFKEKLISKFKDEFQFFGLSKQQILFAKAIENGKVSDITGKKIWQACFNMKNVQNQMRIQKQLSDLQDRIDGILKKLHAELQIQKSQILSEIQYLKTGDQSRILFQRSKIISPDKINNLANFFQNKAIKATNLLYRASQNQFQVSKFHSKCDNIPNTLTVCQTQFGKVIGGYTPLIWFKTETDDFIQDQTGQSFIFSLTNNDKFVLQEKQNAIYLNKDDQYGPQFGWGRDFVICNRAHQDSKSLSCINYSYVNSGYTKADKESYERFCGNQSATSNQYFKTKQWQVWEIQFSDQKQKPV